MLLWPEIQPDTFFTFFFTFVVENHGEVEYVADPEALEYRQSLGMSDEDQEFIERVYEKVGEGSTEGGEEN